MMTDPIILVPACTKEMGNHFYHAVQMKYVNSIIQGTGCVPLILPSLGGETNWETVLHVADGVLLTGSPSNVHPDHFGQPVRDSALPLDRARDATTLPLIRAVLQRRIPLLGICRGAQEMNVALGGTLHQAVHEVSGLRDHREDPTLPLQEQYRPVHRVSICPDGWLATILHGRQEMMVNSLHGQGVNQLAPGLRVEAIAEDGLVEAFSMENAQGFSLAVQWHPEWRVTENPESKKLFAAFGDACRQYHIQKKPTVNK